MGLVAFEALAQMPIQFRIARFPKLVADMDAAEINVASPERKDGGFPISAFGFRISDFVHLSTLFLLIGVTGIEDDAVAGLERGVQGEGDALPFYLTDFAEVHAAFLAEAGMDEFLVVVAIEPTGVEAAREGHFHRILRGVPRVEGRGSRAD